jgi:hypothetical protein
MKSNLGMNDRAIRLALGVVISSFLIYQNTVWAMIGLIPFITGAIGYCPLYKLIGINTLNYRKSN